MDIQKEREAFEKLWTDGNGHFKFFKFDQDDCKYRLNGVTDNLPKEDLLLSSIILNTAWLFWLSAKKQAVPEGFVLVPKELSDELADELASDAFNNIQSMFDYEHRGSTDTHREQIRLRWCKNKAREFQENYKIVIEAQEQAND